MNSVQTYFFGFSGSSGPSQSIMRTSSSGGVSTPVLGDGASAAVLDSNEWVEAAKFGSRFFTLAAREVGSDPRTV